MQQQPIARRVVPFLPLAVIFLLLVLPAPAFAAYIPYPPRIGSQSTVLLNGTIETAPCCFEKFSYCMDNQTKATDGISEVQQFLGNDTYSLTNFTSHTEIYCLNGCSLQLNGCREPPITELVILTAFAFVAGILIYLSPRIGPLGIFVSLLLIIISLALSLTDFFSDPMLMFARLLTFALTVFACVNFYMASKSPPEEDEEGVVNA